MALLRTLSLVAGAFSVGVSVGIGASAGLSSRPSRAEPTASAQPPRGAPLPEARPALDPPTEPAASLPEHASRIAPLVPACGDGLQRRLCAPPGSAPRPELAWLIGLRAPELPVHASPRVERYFRYLTETSAGRSQVRGWLARGDAYRGIVQHVLRARGLPRDLEAVVAVESAYAPRATSRNGAAGLWQFMPATARAYGLSVGDELDERRSVRRSTEAAARYLEDLDRRFGSWELALAAYDMGYGRLRAHLRTAPSSDYWAMAAAPGALPEEVLQYVPKVLAVAIVLRNLGPYGFDEPSGEPVGATADVDVPGGTPLDLVARAAGTSVAGLRALNPELLAGHLPQREGSFVVHVPSSGAARAATMLPRLLTPSRTGRDETIHVGETFDWGADELPPRDEARASGQP